MIFVSETYETFKIYNIVFTQNDNCKYYADLSMFPPVELAGLHMMAPEAHLMAPYNEM